MSKILKAAFVKLNKFLSIDVNPDPVVISSIRSLADVQRWRVFSDSTFGGASKGALELCSEDGKDEASSRSSSSSAPSTSSPQAHNHDNKNTPPTPLQQGHASQGHPFMRFSGRYSMALTEGATLIRAGYVGCNNVLPRSLDLSMHDYLEFNIRAREQHTYVANVRTDNYTGGDEEVWQAPLRPTKPGEWESVPVQFDELIYTVRGRVCKNQAGGRMPRRSVMAVGLTLPVTKNMGEEGDFCLDIASVEAKAEHLQGDAAQQKAFQGYLSSHDDLREPDGFTCRPQTSAAVGSGQSIGGRSLRKRKHEGLKELDEKEGVIQQTSVGREQ